VTTYRRLTGTLPRAVADKLWGDLVAYRKATRQPWRIARRKYGKGYALYEVLDTPQGAQEGPGRPSGGKGATGAV
jgi:hypothetical protein